MTMQGRPSSTDTSWMCTMFGWLSFAAARASRRKSSTKRSSSTRCGRIALTTTGRITLPCIR